MARLFKTIDDIKVFCPMIGSSDFGNFAPFIDQAERDFIIPYIGKDQYEALVSAYNEDGSGEMDDTDLALLLKVQAAVAFYMEYLWIPSGQVSIGDNGIRVAYTETQKPAFAWQIKDLRREVIRQAGSAMDSLLEFLEENKDDYDLWTESDVCPEYNDTFVRSAKEFTKFYSPLGNSRLNFLAIRPALKRVEEFIIQSELGPDFYEELKEQFKDDDVSEENEPIIEFIQKAVVQLTMARAFTDVSVSLDERGVLMFNSTHSTDVVDGKEPSKDSYLSKMEAACDKDGRAYIQLLKNYLKANIGDYPTYAQSDSYDSSTTDTTLKNSPDSNLYGMI
jgi:hypothetical protein